MCGWTDRSLSETKQRRRASGAACSRGRRRTSLSGARSTTCAVAWVGPIGVVRGLSATRRTGAPSISALNPMFSKTTPRASRTTRMSPISSRAPGLPTISKSVPPVDSRMSPEALSCTSPASVRNDPTQRVPPRARRDERRSTIAAKAATSINRAHARCYCDCAQRNP